MLRTKNIHLFIFYIFCSCISYAQSNNQPYPKFDSPAKNLAKAKKFIEENDEENALLYLNRYISDKYDDEEALFLRARIYSNKDELLNALTDYNSLLELNVSSKEYLYNRGVIRYKMKQFEMALEDFYRSIKLPNETTQTAFLIIDPGSQAVSGVSTLNGMEENIWNNIGLCHQALDQNEKAIYAFRQGLQINPASPDLYLNAALSYERTGDLEKAEQNYRYVLSLYPENSIAHFNLMNLRRNLESDEQLQNLNFFIAENPNAPQGYASRGLFFFESKNYKLALIDLEKAMYLDPDHIDYIFNLAMTYEKLDRFDEAERLFDQITSMDARHASAYFNLGNIQYKRKAYEEAISLFSIAYYLDGTNPAILYNRAIAKFQAGKKIEACNDMELVNLLDPKLGEKFYNTNCMEN